MSDSTELDIRRERAAKNEILFREVNERIEGLSAASALDGYVCECADKGCDQRVSLTVKEYEHVRSRPEWFVVVPGHNTLGLDSIEVASDRYFVVSKLGAGAQVARETDPRSAGR